MIALLENFASLSWIDVQVMKGNDRGGGDYGGNERNDRIEILR